MVFCILVGVLLNKGLFVTDFDGTLLRSDGSFSQRDIDALETLAQRGVKTAIATGRSLYSFEHSTGVDLKIDYPGGHCLGHFACDLPLAGAGAVCDFRAQQIQWIYFF